MLQMLKIHRSDPQLIVQLRFSGRQPCRRFLCAYREGALRAALESRLAAALALRSLRLQLELRAGAELLDALLTDEERCLSCIFAQKVRPGGGQDRVVRGSVAKTPTDSALPSLARPAPGRGTR